MYKTTQCQHPGKNNTYNQICLISRFNNL